MANIAIPLITTLAPIIYDLFKNSGGNNGGQNLQGNGWSGYPTQQTGYVNNFDPQRQQGLTNWLQGLQSSGLQNQSLNTLSQQQQPFNANQYMDFFNQGVVQPSLRNYNEDILPQIRSQFNRGGGRHTGALNQAIGRSAENLAQGLGSLRANYLSQGQQQWRNQQNQAAAQSLGLFQNAYGGNNVTPIVQNAQPGGIQEFIKALLSGGGKAIASNWDPSKGFDQWFGGSSSQAATPSWATPGFGGASDPHSYLQSQMGRF